MSTYTISRVIRFEAPSITVVQCEDCRTLHADVVQAGRHGAHFIQAECGHFRLVNCVKRFVGDCEGCASARGEGRDHD